MLANHLGYSVTTINLAFSCLSTSYFIFNVYSGLIFLSFCLTGLASEYIQRDFMLNYVCAEFRYIIVGPCKDILVFFQKVNQACSFFESQIKVVPIPNLLGSSVVPKEIGWLSSLTGGAFLFSDLSTISKSSGGVSP